MKACWSSSQWHEDSVSRGPSMGFGTTWAGFKLESQLTPLSVMWPLPVFSTITWGEWREAAGVACSTVGAGNEMWMKPPINRTFCPEELLVPHPNPWDPHACQGESSIAALKASGDSLSTKHSLTDRGKFSWKWAKCFHQTVAEFQGRWRRWQTKPLSAPPRPTSWHSDQALFLTHVPGEQLVIWGPGLAVHPDSCLGLLPARVVPFHTVT